MKTALCTALMLAAGTATAQNCTITNNGIVAEYDQNFETFPVAIQGTEECSLSGDGWIVGANVFDGFGNFLYNYFAFPALNEGSAFQAVVDGQGGPPQGDRVLSVFSDYNNGDHGNGNTISANTFREYTIDAGNIGQTWYFSFDSKLGNITEAPSSTATAFIATIDPANGFAQTNRIVFDSSAVVGVNWDRYEISLDLTDPLLEGQLFQIGFESSATNFDASGMFYDNIVLSQTPTIGGGGDDRLCGDVNDDGSINDSDFFAWVTAFTASPQTPEQLTACDVNNDGNCNDSDFFAWVTEFTNALSGGTLSECPNL
ncbi:MAG: dockerin type I domain-containing protein [Planctomycetota bacterium]